LDAAHHRTHWYEYERGLHWYYYEETLDRLIQARGDTRNYVVTRSPSRARRSRRASQPSTAEPIGLVATDERRDTGIRVIGDMPWGAHLCIFYETRQDLLDTAVSYFAAGLRSNEFCIWATSDPITETDAKDALRAAVPDFDDCIAAGQMEIIRGEEWYLPGGEFDMQRVTNGWREKLQSALARGFEGMRASGNAFWIATNQWKEFSEYEQELDRSLDGQKMLALCTYSLQASRAVDILDVARAHQCSTARRHGDWEFLETPELRLARSEIRRLNGAIDVLSKPFPGIDSLTPRERVTLAQIVRGASSKEAARSLGISPRTVEFHRANIMQKLGTKNVADLVRRVVGE
jgi:DNA-binding CsgD family transcriptional regulator